MPRARTVELALAGGLLTGIVAGALRPDAAGDAAGAAVLARAHVSAETGPAHVSGETRPAHVSATRDPLGTTRVSGETLDAEASAGLGRLVEGVLRHGAPARRAAEAASLEASLVALDARGGDETELMDVASGLDRLLRDEPSFLPAVRAAFARARDRRVAFVLARALAAHDDEATREAFATAAGAGAPPGRREAALCALATSRDARAAGLARSALEDAAAPDEVRVAAAFALGRQLATASKEDRSPAVRAAHALAVGPGSSPALKAGALELLADLPGSDVAAERALARASLAATDEPVVLASARLALARGEDPAAVARALKTHGGERALRTAEILEGPRGPGGRP